MPLAKEVAVELRKLADALDTAAETAVPTPLVMFSTRKKEEFIALAHLMPRPLKKGLDFEGTSYTDRTLTHSNEAIWIKATIPQSLTCELVEPAKPAVYRCDPILSASEDAELEVV